MHIPEKGLFIVIGKYYFLEHRSFKVPVSKQTTQFYIEMTHNCLQIVKKVRNLLFQLR